MKHENSFDSMRVGSRATQPGISRGRGLGAGYLLGLRLRMRNLRGGYKLDAPQRRRRNRLL